MTFTFAKHLLANRPMQPYAQAQIHMHSQHSRNAQYIFHITPHTYTVYLLVHFHCLRDVASAGQQNFAGKPVHQFIGLGAIPNRLRVLVDSRRGAARGIEPVRVLRKRISFPGSGTISFYEKKIYASYASILKILANNS